MVAVDDGYRRRCHPTPIRPGAAFRGRAREHPISPFGNERCKRRPGQSGAGRVSPSRRPRPRKPGSSFGRRAHNIQRHPRHRPMRSLKGIAPEAPAHVSVRLWAAYGGEGGEKSCVSTAASTPVCDAFDGDFVQQLVSNFGHMATVLKCKKCGKFKPFTDYDGSEWQKDRKKRLCKGCKRGPAPLPTDAGQPSAAATGDAASAGAGGDFVAASPP